MVIEGKIIEQVMEFNCLRNKISEYNDMEYKLQTYNINIGIIIRHLVNKIRIYNMT
jgi:hypothetical protein